MNKTSEEYIDIVTESGAPTGKVALKDDAHRNGWYHNTIHLWLYTKNGEILLQQRSHKKSIYPLLWDVSAAGHVDAGESLINAAIRETREELGLLLKPEQLTKIGIHKHCKNYNNGQIKDYEFHHVFIAELTVNIEELKPDDEEVEALKLISISEFLYLLTHSQTNNHFVGENRDYYLFIVQKIKKSLKI
ncbi:NUDIX domain-containing protein [Paucihalobacter ruber]|uniref:NUDIX domain-containing protein n=1 Tax=Paucihalobacter ruber TaxID=2567861 RepID=A0A506PGC3_9FLAO|nr:NUDIX domain-containing protein [Paucihalobacter ruber]TPV32465.1 NUDIX domain-containing protein [Paucihalobacter ruber]